MYTAVLWIGETNRIWCFCFSSVPKEAEEGAQSQEATARPAGVGDETAVAV